MTMQNRFQYSVGCVKQWQNSVHVVVECPLCRCNAFTVKEVCNRGVACSLLKLGSLEKTVIASLFHSGTIFLWKKRCRMSF